MAYIKRKKNQRDGITYFQLVESYREGVKVRQNVLFHIGKSLVIPRDVIRKFRINKENLARMKQKYPELKIESKEE